MTIIGGQVDTLQLLYTIISSENRLIMYCNDSEHPVRIDRNHVLGRASITTPGSFIIETGEQLNWASLDEPTHPF